MKKTPRDFQREIKSQKSVIKKSEVPEIREMSASGYSLDPSEITDPTMTEVELMNIKVRNDNVASSTI